MDSRHWHVLGAGSIGGLFACLLDQAGVSCSLLLRPSDPALAQGSTRITLRAGTAAREHELALGSATADAPIRHLLVCTKAYDLLAGIASILPRLAPDAVIVLLANGLGYQQRIAAQWPQLTVVSGSTTEGAYRAADHQVQRAGRGTTWLGGTQPCAPDWFSDWQALDAECVWTNNMNVVLWRKLAINCAINPLTALHRCRNGVLAERSALTQEVQALCREIAAVAEAAGQPDAVHDLYNTVMHVITATADNRSSMLQDVLAKRRTEIDYLTGYLVATADRLDIALPHNRALLVALRALEAGQARRQSS